MKKIFVFMLMAVVFSIATWGQNTAPLSEGFENGVPNGWTIVGVAGSEPVALSSDFSNGGSSSIYFAYDCEQDAEGYLITPELRPTEANHTLSFHVFSGYPEYSGDNTFTVEISTQGSSVVSFTTVLQAITLTDSWEQQTIDLSSYIGQSVYIAFHMVDNCGAGAYIDDISGVDYVLPECSAPIISLGNITENSVSLSWEGDAESYTVKYGKYGSNESTWQGQVVSTNAITLSGLDHSTAYIVKVISNCESTEQELYRTVTFRTLCSTVTEFPYTEDFETMTTYNDFGCWTDEVVSGASLWEMRESSLSGNVAFRIWTGGAVNRLVSPVFNISSLEHPHLSYNWEVHRDNNLLDSMYVYYRTSAEGEWNLLAAHGPNSEGNTNYNATQFNDISLPADAISPTLQVSFLAVGHGGYGIVLDNISIINVDCESPYNVVITNPAGHSAVVSWEGDADVLEYKVVGTDTWTTDANFSMLSPYTLSDLSPETSYLLRVGKTCNSNTISYYPQVSFTTDIACPAPVVSLSNLTSQSATISWTGDATNYSLKYKQTNATEYITETLVTGNSYSFSSLTPTTSYTVELQAICGDDGNSQVTTFIFSTMQIPASLPYYTDFAQTSDRDWLFNNYTSQNYWTIGSLGEDNYAMFITNDGTASAYTVSNSQARVSAEKTFNGVSSEQLHIEFDVNIGGETSWDYMKVFLTPASWSFPASEDENEYSSVLYEENAMDFSEYLSQTGDSYYPFKLNLTQGNTLHISKDMTNPNPNEAIKLTFVWRNDYSSGTQPAAEIYNVRVAPVLCPTPSDSAFAINNIVGHSAKITVAPTDREYTVSYRPESASEDTWTAITFNNNEGTITNLEPQTSYIVRFAYNCGETISEYIFKTFTTTVSCPAPEIEVSEVSVSQATLTWTGEAESYTVSYGFYNADQTTWTTVNVSGNTITLQDLTSSTAYGVSIVANCDAENSPAGEVAFRTSCTTIVLNNQTSFNEDFEAYTSSDWGCWTDEVISGFSNWTIQTSSISGKVAYRTYSNGARNRLVSPFFDITAVTTPYLSYNWEVHRDNSQLDSMLVFYRTSLNGEWVLLKAHAPNANGTTNYNPAQFTSIEIPAEAISSTFQVSFLAVGHGGWGMCIDNVSLQNITCPAPTDVTMSNISSTHATVSWESESENFVVSYKTTGANAEWEEVSGITTSTYTITDLEPQTSYVVRIGAVCDDEVSWSIEQTFATVQAPVDLPYSTNFSGEGEAGDINWIMYNATGSNHWAIGSLGTTANEETEYGMFVTSNGTSSVYNISSSSIAGTEKVFNATSSGQIHVEFDVEVGGESSNSDAYCYDYMKVFLSPAAWSFTDVENSYDYNYSTYALDFTEYASLSNHTHAIQSPYKFSQTNGFVHISKDMTNPNPDGAVKLTFLWRNDNSAGTQPAAKIKNLVVSMVSCASPIVTLTEVTPETATLSVIPTEAVYDAQYKLASSSDEESSWLPLTVTDGTIEMTNLVPATSYDIRVATICTEGNSMYTNLTITTSCTDITEAMLPKTWDFETANVEGSYLYPLPACWNRIFTSYIDELPYVYTANTAAHSGNKVLSFDGYITSYAILPVISEDLDINTLQLTFQAMHNSGDYADYLEIGVMTSPTDTNTFTLIATTAPLSDLAYQVIDVPFSSYEGNGRYIAIRNKNNGYSYSQVYIDDVVLGLIPVCTRPTIISTETTTSTATLTWTSSASEFDVYYRILGSDEEFTLWAGEVPTQVEDAEETWTLTLTNLQHSEIYEYYISALCTGNDPQESNIATLVMQCEPVTDLPYTQNFDLVAEGNLPNCWSKVMEYDGFPAVISNTEHSTYSNSGTNSLKMNTYGSEQYAVLPAFAADINTLHLAFAAKREGAYSGTLHVGYMTDPANASTFTSVYSVSASDLGDENYHHYEVSFENVELSGETTPYMAFKYVSTYSWFFFIDDVEVGLLPECTRPTITSVEPESEQVTISWTSTGTAFEVYYKESSVAEYGAPLTSYESLSEENAYTITISGLNPATTYDFYVKTTCGETVLQSFTAQFFTPQLVATLPYSTNFSGQAETGDTDWLFVTGSGENYWTIGSLGSDTYGLFVTNNGTSSGYDITSTSTVGAEKTFSVGSEGEIHIEFDVNVGGEGSSYSSYDYMKVFLSPATWSFTESNNYYSENYSTYAMDFSDFLSNTLSSSHPYKFNLTDGNTVHISTNMTNPNPNGAVKLTFLWRNDASGGTQPAAEITNFSISAVECSAPAEFVVNVTSNSATATLLEGNEYVADYKLSSEGDDAWQPVTLTGNVVTLTDLTPATSYDLRVALVCGDDYSAYRIQTFTTLCDAIIEFPYLVGFDDQAQLTCWSKEIVSGTNDWQTTSISGNSVAYSTYSVGRRRFISPLFDITSLTNPYLSYDYEIRSDASTQQDSIYVYYRTNTDEEWSLLAQYGPNASGAFSGSELSQHDSVALPNATATYQVMFEGVGNYGWGQYLDNVKIDAAVEPCTPVAMTITETVCFGETYTFNGQTYNATGTYTTTVAGQGTDCDTNYTINLTVLPQNTASETVTVCAGATATFNGQTLTEGTNTITVAGQGTDCDTLYTVTLVVLQPTSSTTDVTVCYGETYEFNGQTYNATGTYTATLTNAAGCDSVATLNLTVRPANAPIEETVTLNTAELPYTWRGEQYTEFGTYTVTGEDENGCPQEYVLTLVHNSGIAEVENEYSIALYPNPTSENATLSVKGLNEEATVIVTDQAGRVISTTKLALGQETMEVETSKLASGVYYIRIQTANSVRTEKLIRK